MDCRDSREIVRTGSHWFKTATLRFTLRGAVARQCSNARDGARAWIRHLWTLAQFNCRQSASSPPGTILKRFFSCAKAVAMFDSIGGTYTGSNVQVTA